MRCRGFLHQSLAVVLVLASLTGPIIAQRRPTPAPPQKTPVKTVSAEKAPAIDALISADAYKVYGEIKNVGTLVSTGSISELVDPVMKLADPPKEFKELIKFINANAEMLADSRMIFATSRAREFVPAVFVVIEMASPEDAARFEPKLNRLLPVLIPTPRPTPTAEEKSPAEAHGTADKNAGPQPQAIKSKDDPGNPAEEIKATPPPFVVTRSGNLVFVSDRPFKFEKLRPADSKLLTEDPNFRQAYERFSTEPVFVFINIALPELRYKEPTAEKAVAVAAPTPEIAEKDDNEPKEEAVIADQPIPHEDAQVEQKGELSVQIEAPPPPTPKVSMFAVSSLVDLLSGGPPEWPDAIGLALSQEADDYVIRSILIGPQNSKRTLVPFVPQLLAGRPLSPNAPSVLPVETELFVSMSLDLPRMHQEMLVRLEETKKHTVEQLRKLPASQRPAEEKPYDPFADFETKGGFKIKEELLPALGGEIAITASLSALEGAGVSFGVPRPRRPPIEEKETEESKAQKQRQQESMPAVLISVRDRETVRRLMPKVLDGLGVGLANMIGTSVRRDDTEMVDFAGAFAYAFVGDYLVISTTPTVRHIIDSYLSHQTLSSNSAYRNFTRWEPSGIVGQIYVSPTLMEDMQKGANDPSQAMNVPMREYLLHLNPTPQAISYALSNEGFGAMHELHLPKALVLAAVAGTANATKNPPPEMNESIALSLLQAIAGAEETYKSTAGSGSYGSLDKLIAAKLVQKDILEKYGYRFEVVVTNTSFEATATPVEYGKTGRMSYFIDSTHILRGGDIGGGPASSGNKPIR
ncbi:MAG TPA: hypothetical protein VN643_16205 [Pyrinomonadaceae bacterium]|nr:hypothetical protein [Pyrinomonadaceae bacterium]